MVSFDVWPGVPYPLGATASREGTNFAIAAPHATGVDLCLFDEKEPLRELARLPLRDTTHHVFHGFVPGLGHGALYGFRVHGPWAPWEGHRFNPNKLVVDPYARAVCGKPDFSFPMQGHQPGQTLARDERDSAPGAPRAVVVDDDFDWRGDVRPQVIWRRAIFYEVHVKGFTQLHPEVPEALRGTYAGLAHPAVIRHLLELGVTSVQLLPVQESVSEPFLVERGLTNYWGYNPLGFFAPDQRFSASGNRGQQVREFKEMVRSLHAVGLEVILDVVFNHSGEGPEQGPTLSLRGLDNATYYWLDSTQKAHYRDFTGCGNSLAVHRPQVLKLVMDALRYWVTEMHVDGFRFDLATTLARGAHGEFDATSSFLAALYQDPLLSRVKLIAEPWDVGPYGYRLGNFPAPFAEWNDRYRTAARRFWRQDTGQLAELGYRLSGSSDYFKVSGRRPTASVNYIACHDGFTLTDVVSYSTKHNEANLEDNRDGVDENHASNGGVEGPCEDQVVLANRERLARNLLSTLFLSVGTPLLLAGDEMGRTQLGNNNAYCQDNELSWVHWNLTEWQRARLAFTKRLIALRLSQPVLQRRSFFLGQSLDDSRFRDLVWFHPEGRELGHDDWHQHDLRCFGFFLGGDAITARDPAGQRLVGDTLLVYFNAASEPLTVRLPEASWGQTWGLVLSTDSDLPQHRDWKAGESWHVPAQSVVVLRQLDAPTSA